MSAAPTPSEGARRQDPPGSGRLAAASVARDARAARLALADPHGFARPGAGRERRAALATHNLNWLRQVWEDTTEGLDTTGWALAAVGSVARGDAGPLSDYDLVLLHADRSLSSRAANEVADRVLYPLWDAGIKLDHSVRSLHQCRAMAGADLAVAVGLLDLVPIAGARGLVARVRDEVAADWRGTVRKRLPEVSAQIAERHARQGEIAQSLEPDLKEGGGGFRDLRVMTALAQAWLADRPHPAVDAAHERLLDVRDAIHVVTGRGRDRLGRDDHDAVAALLGYADRDDLLTDVSLAGRTITHALQGTLRRAGQAQRARTLRVRPRRPELTPLGHGIHVSDGEVVLASRELAMDALMPLRVAAVAARRNLPVSPATLENLSRSPGLPDPWPGDALELFGDLLGAGSGLLPVWEAFDQAGIVARWLPEWDAVRSRPQHNPVHRHTVDRHLLECVVQAQARAREVARPDLLLLAALLHDIGKVKGARDHSREGAPVAARIATRMGLPPEEVALIEVLVREHLTLIDLATRRDHADPATVAAAHEASRGDRAVFDLLVCLTEADASATGPKAWTDWRATLLGQLVAAVRARTPEQAREATETVSEPVAPPDLPGGRPVVTVQALGSAWRVDVLADDRLGLFADTAGLLAVQGLAVRAAILRTVDGVAVDEWYVESPGGDAPDAARLLRGLARLGEGDREPLASLRGRPASAASGGSARLGQPGQTRAFLLPGASADATVIEVRTADRRGLLHDLGRAFAEAGISVRSAHISTHAGQTLDTFYLTDAGGSPLAPARVGALVGWVIDTCG